MVRHRESGLAGKRQPQLQRHSAAFSSVCASTAAQAPSATSMAPGNTASKASPHHSQLSEAVVRENAVSTLRRIIAAATDVLGQLSIDATADTGTGGAARHRRKRGTRAGKAVKTRLAAAHAAVSSTGAGGEVHSSEEENLVCHVPLNPLRWKLACKGKTG
jgi:hypothetical protein